MEKICKKCFKPLTGKQTSFCSEKCSRRFLKLEWQRRNKDVVNKAKRLWRLRTGRAGDNRWNATNAFKKAAHSKVFAAITNGILVRKPCEVCGEPEVQAHHDDYSKPLEVRWLCAKHHVQHHRGVVS